MGDLTTTITDLENKICVIAESSQDANEPDGTTDVTFTDGSLWFIEEEV